MINHDFFNSSKQLVIPNAIEYDFSEIELLLEKRKKTNSKQVRFVYLGTLSEQKGIRWMISAFNKLEEKAELYIAGKGSLSKYVEEECSKNKRIHFVGFLNELQVDELLKKCDVLICPSQWQEPFGRVVLDAYKRAMPVICSDQGALPTLVDDKKTGFVVASGHEKDLTQAMQTYVMNRELIIEHASAGVKKLDMFSLKRQAISFMNEYKRDNN